MSDILSVFTQNILPILIIAGFGFALQRWKALDKQALTSAVFNVLSPALVFSSLVNSRLPGGELIELGIFALLSMIAMGIIGFGLAHLLRFSRVETAAFLIVIIFVNSGNFGLTLAQLRYGDTGLSRAIVYYATSTFLVYTFGVVIASLGKLNWREALERLIRLPAIYAAVAAVIVYSWHIAVPAPLMSAVELAGQGAIPVMLVVLGMQMADTRSGFSLRLALPAVSTRLLVGPLVGVALANLMGLQGLGRNVSIIQAGMPPAVFSIILATEFGLQAAAVTGVVVLATLLSPLTLALTITFLGM